MFFYISKFFAFAVSPLFWIFLFVFCGWYFRKKNYSKYFYYFSLFLLIFFSNPYLFQQVVKWVEPELKVENLQKRHFKYGVVLGGMAVYNPTTDSPRFARSADRLWQGLDLLQKGIVDKLIISGGSARILFEERKESEILKKYLLKLGIADSLVLIDTLSRNTIENASYTKEILIQQKAENDSIVLVTSAMHMPRSQATFQQINLKVFPYPVDAIRAIQPLSFDEYIFPSATVLAEWEAVIRELIGRLVYWMRF